MIDYIMHYINTQSHASKCASKFAMGLIPTMDFALCSMELLKTLMKCKHLVSRWVDMLFADLLDRAPACDEDGGLPKSDHLILVGDTFNHLGAQISRTHV